MLRLRSDGSAQYEPVVQFDQASNRYVPLPIDLGPPTDRLVLALFGTGFRLRNDLDTVSATIGGLPVVVDYAGPQGTLVGVDQANLLLDRNLAGRGEVDVSLTVAGVVSNTVKVVIK